MSADPAAGPELTVVIPTLGARPVALGRALDSALRSAREAGAAVQLLVVSDAADPEPTDTALLVGSRIGTRHLRASRPGASAARNTGWRAAEAPLVLFLDDDILAGPALIAEHLAGHRADPADAAAVLGLVRWAAEIAPTALMRWLDRGIQFGYGELQDGGDAGWGRLYTANVSLKRAALERVQGFDEERFPFGYEDLDLGLRLHHELGLRLQYRAAAVAEHLHEPRLAEWRDRIARIAVAERAFVACHPDVPPYFHDLFTRALAQPAPRGRGARLAGVIPPSAPWLGVRAQASAEARFLHDLGPRFLAAWAQAGSGQPPGGESGTAPRPGVAGS